MLPLRRSHSFVAYSCSQPRLRVLSLPFRQELTFATKLRRNRIEKSPPKESLPRPKRNPVRTQDAAQRYPKDSAEVTALKARLLERVWNTRVDFTFVNEISSISASLIETKTYLNKTLVVALMTWICKATLLTDSFLAKDPTLAKDTTFQEQRNELSLLLDGFIDQYKKGRFEVNGYIPAFILSHYKSTDQFDEALELWDWLCRIRESGHLTYQVYAARIAIAEDMGEGCDACEKLYQEALAKLGDELVTYHLSHNAIVSEPHLPLSNDVCSTASLLQTMFGIRLRNGDWRNAYLTLDTQLRIFSESLSPFAKSEILTTQSSWEAFHLENLENVLRGRKLPRQSVVTEWLLALVSRSNQPDKITSLRPSRLHSIICTMLSVLEWRHVAEYPMSSRKEKSDPTQVYGELLVLWDSWMKLCLWHGGKDEVTSSTESGRGAAVMSDLILNSIQRIGIQSMTPLKDLSIRMRKNLRLISRMDPNPEFAAASGHVLDEIQARIAELRNTDKPQALFPNIPHWSNLLSRDDMMGLYQELGLSSSIMSEIGVEASDPVDNAEFESEAPLEEPQVEPWQFRYQTKTGISLEEIRFQSWMTINNMFLVADEFERHGCLHGQSMADVLDQETAIRQAEVLEMFDPEKMSADEKAERKGLLLDRLRNFRQHQGHLHSGF